jgi:hypothetical protein
LLNILFGDSSLQPTTRETCLDPVDDDNDDECKGLLGACLDMLSKIKEKNDNNKGGGGDWSELPMMFASMMGKTRASPIRTPDHLELFQTP